MADLLSDWRIVMSTGHGEGSESAFCKVVVLTCFDAEYEGSELFWGGGDDDVRVVALAEFDGAVVCGDVQAV
jgi:hypothetical protein